MISEERLQDIENAISAASMSEFWTRSTIRELVGEARRANVLESRIKSLLDDINATTENLVQTRRERDYLARQCERLDDGRRDEKAWRNIAWEACLG